MLSTDVALLGWRSLFVADFETLDKVTGALEGGVGYGAGRRRRKASIAAA
jgi:hypothetical protein